MDSYLPPRGRVYSHRLLAVVDLLRWSLAAVLVGTAVAKLLSGGAGRAAFRSYEIESPRTRAALWGAVIAAEAALGAAVAARVPGAAEAAAAMLVVFAAALVGAIRSGRAGRPCACFGGSFGLVLGVSSRWLLQRVAHRGGKISPCAEGAATDATG